MVVEWRIKLLRVSSQEMKMEKQERAFECELHALCTRFFDEWDIPPESMLEILESEKLFVMSILFTQANEDDEEEDEDEEE